MVPRPRAGGVTADITADVINATYINLVLLSGKAWRRGVRMIQAGYEARHLPTTYISMFFMFLSA